jgi:hypothetical protein
MTNVNTVKHDTHKIRYFCHYNKKYENTSQLMEIGQHKIMRPYATKQRNVSNEITTPFWPYDV